MEEIRDEGIKILYAIIRENEDAEARYDQKEAIRQIKQLAFQEILMPSQHWIVSGMLRICTHSCGK